MVGGSAMLTHLRLKNFKSWKDTGDIALRPITAIFGANSSGKSALIQSLLMLKQTAEASDRNLTFHFGGPNALVDLGDFASVVHRHDRSGAVELSLGWETPAFRFRGKRPQATDEDEQVHLQFTVRADQRGGSDTAVSTERMVYRVGDAELGMRRQADPTEYELLTQGVEKQGRLGEPLEPGPLQRPVKFYGFPTGAYLYFGGAVGTYDLAFALERCLQGIYYLGPLRAQPRRDYRWSSAQPVDVGRSGELAVDAIVGSRRGQHSARDSRGTVNERIDLEDQLSRLFNEIGLLHEFRVEQIADNPLYQIKVRQSEGGSETLITDVGFGVSQILPVLVLCFYAPTGSTIILEQPEIHLHPAVQSALGDVLIAARQRRKVQIIVESHSEHLLRRLQRRIAEEKLPESDLGAYFCENDGAESKLTTLELNPYGSITNWPNDFFGDDFGEFAAMTEAAVRRRSTDAAG